MRIGVDVGGTFTDMVLLDEKRGTLRAIKVPSTPDAPERAIGLGLRQMFGHDAVANLSYFMHGTTVALNALIQRQGATVAILATRGFTDVLEVARGERASISNLHWKPEPPLVPRHRRLPIRERVFADGTIEQPLVEADVLEAARTIMGMGVDSIAITYLNAYRNGQHERRTRELLIDAGFTGTISLSHEISGEYREYERFSTTVVDAFVRPRIEAYFSGVNDALADEGFSGRALVTTSGGGSVSFGDAARRPFQIIQSGTVAGAMGAADLCARLNIPLAVTADVGGTSFDAALIADFRPRLKHEGRALGMPVQTPWVDVRSIGAGGGSLAQVDTGGLMHVGPNSAGAVPGPVCYDKGGDRATATDAAAHLGMLGAGRLAGGFSLNLSAAQETMCDLGQEIGTDADSAAHGVLTVLTSNMAGLIQEICAEYGEDVRASSLIAFGGSGPLFATLIATELGVSRIVIPEFAGNFSAWSLLSQEVVQAGAISTLLRVDDRGLREAERLIAPLLIDLRSRIEPNDYPTLEEVSLDIRYAGQEYTLTIGCSFANGIISDDPDKLNERFTSEYSRVFQTSLRGPIEITTIRGAIASAVPKPALDLLVDEASPADDLDPDADCFSFTRKERVHFTVLHRSTLPLGALVQGPALVVEETSITYVDAGFTVRVHPTRSLIMEKDA